MDVAIYQSYRIYGYTNKMHCLFQCVVATDDEVHTCTNLPEKYSQKLAAWHTLNGEDILFEDSQKINKITVIKKKHVCEQ